MFGKIGMWELVLILLVLVLIFGANKLPQLGRSIGDGIKEFRKGVKTDEPEGKDEKNDKA
ncbi:MAG TPA: twin-arginine translocase TatA/TatE family subunit [Symbiobacteriaceae bacterium]|nr:twin-arginine translocase TatA/TatE family subunit [Symbiobacteriaceae bacterium]